ncbi:Sugar transporter, conserved site,Major facilitator superfamily domain,Major facilitator, sugar [Cinara cedri]|uniref:Sugar transporter, conserved site,Major facilitator superfamily domain,Major facilitator, sugar n=1 Tax=Cinara cedri TaxID=506608 RepID=A0A5E4MEA1_9HEMI|nr:Sugar transporter, conserved site,Major facilitator superfamily domain,Major facilitator, sugar [Cinara cedri]
MFNSHVFRQIYVTLIASFSIFISGMWLGWPSSVVEKFIKHETDFNVNIDQLSWIVAMMDLGNIVSPLFAGYMMDTIGRKTSNVILGPLFIVAWLLAIYVPTPWALYTARLMAGLGKGISYTVVPIFVGEIASVKIRGALSTSFCVQLHLGFLFEAIVGPLVSYKTLNVVSATMPVLFFLVAVWIPESPYYLLKKNRPLEAAKCLQWFRHEDNIQAELQQMEVNMKNDTQNQSSVREMFSSRKNLRALGIVVVTCASQRAGGISCIYAYSSLILPDPAPVIGKSEYIMLFATLLVIVNFVGLALVDQVGRKPLLIFSQTGLGVICLLFALYFYANEHNDDVQIQYTWFPYLCHVLFSIIFAIGVGFMPVVFLGEMFPVNVRSYCSAIASITLSVCSFVTNKIFLLISRYYGYQIMFYVFAIINFASALYSYRYVIETKGKTFLEIQNFLEEIVNFTKSEKI